jgi:uncharacterized protein YfaT (DUF1175 family)
VINDAHSLELYMMAVSLVEGNGTLITIGVTTLREYRSGSLIIHYKPSTGHIDVWSRRKVFSVTRFQDGLRVIQYTPGEWETELEAEAGKPLNRR